MINIAINIEPLPEQVDKFIIKQLNTRAPKSYALLSQSELLHIKKSVENKFPVYHNFDTGIIISLRASYMKNHIINNNHKILKFSNLIINDYDNQMDILKICEKYDISPLNILRHVFNLKYSIKLSKLINSSESELNIWDKSQLTSAIDNDIYALIDQTNVHIQADNFEKMIEVFLIKHNVQYRTQLQLVNEQILSHGKPINTPDFLIDSELYINNFAIKWIDAKNFYGANLPFNKSRIKKQTDKYINSYGSGAIIFSLGFQEKLNFTSILLVNYNAII